MTYLGPIEGFYWVVKTGGFTAAARAFPYPITQPGVHRQVRQLEAELGKKLVRAIGKRRVVPTDDGRALFAIVEPFIASLSRFGDAAPPLRIHASSLVIQHVLPSMLRKSDRAIEVTELETARPEPLFDGSADVLLDFFPSDIPGCKRRVIAHTEAWLVRPARTRPPRKGQEVDAVLYPSGSRAAALQARAFSALGITPKLRVSAQTAEHLLALVAAGLGTSIVPLPSADALPAGVEAQRIPLREARLPIHALWPARTPYPL